MTQIEPCACNDRRYIPVTQIIERRYAHDPVSDRCLGTVLLCRRMTRSPDHRLLTYLARYDPHITHLTLALRELVLEETPEAIESIVKGYAVAIGFSFTGKPL